MCTYSTSNFVWGLGCSENTRKTHSCNSLPYALIHTDYVMFARFLVQSKRIPIALHRAPYEFPGNSENLGMKDAKFRDTNDARLVYAMLCPQGANRALVCNYGTITQFYIFNSLLFFTILHNSIHNHNNTPHIMFTRILANI